MSISAIRILPVTLTDSLHYASATDLDVLSAIELAAFQIGRSKEDTALNQLMFGPLSVVSRDHRADELREKIQTEPTTRMYKAVLAGGSFSDQEEGKIVGFASWNFYDSNHPAPVRTRQEYRPRIFNDCLGALASKRETFMGAGSYAHLETLATLPSYQRRGIGSHLLRLGLQEADKREIPVWVDASPEAYSLYSSLGFYEVAQVRMDLGKYGGDGVAITYCMLRPKVKN